MQFVATLQWELENCSNISEKVNYKKTIIAYCLAIGGE